jgi:ankyrin repeat protein
MKRHSGDEELLDYLIEKENPKFNQRDQYGQTPLLKGAQSSSFSLIYKFIKLRGVDPKMTDDSGRNLFHLFSKYKRIECLDFFSKLEEIKDFTSMLTQKDLLKGWTPLHVAVNSETLDIVVFILEIAEKCNVDVELLHCKDLKGLTPLSLSVQKYQKLKNEMDSNSWKDDLNELKKIEVEKIKIYLEKKKKK